MYLNIVGSRCEFIQESVKTLSAGVQQDYLKPWFYDKNSLRWTWEATFIKNCLIYTWYCDIAIHLKTLHWDWRIKSKIHFSPKITPRLIKLLRYRESFWWKVHKTVIKSRFATPTLKQRCHLILWLLIFGLFWLSANCNSKKCLRKMIHPSSDRELNKLSNDVSYDISGHF